MTTGLEGGCLRVNRSSSSSSSRANAAQPAAPTAHRRAPTQPALQSTPPCSSVIATQRARRERSAESREHFEPMALVLHVLLVVLVRYSYGYDTQAAATWTTEDPERLNCANSVRCTVPLSSRSIAFTIRSTRNGMDSCCSCSRVALPRARAWMLVTLAFLASNSFCSPRARNRA